MYKKNSVYNNTPALPSGTQHSTTEEVGWRMGKWEGMNVGKGREKGKVMCNKIWNQNKLKGQCQMDI